jgi:hypothetical protein
MITTPRPGSWSDVFGTTWVRANGVTVVVEAIHDRGPEPVDSLTVVEPLMFLRCARTADGHLGIVGKGNETGRFLSIFDGATTTWPNLTHGNNCVGAYPSGSTIIGVFIESTTPRPMIVWVDLATRAEIKRDYLPSQDGQYTSQGFVDVTPDGTILLMDFNRTQEVRDWTLVKPNQRSGVVVGQASVEERILLATPENTVFSAYVGYGDDPHLSVLPQGRIAACTYAATGPVLVLVDPPYPPHEVPGGDDGGGGGGGGGGNGEGANMKPPVVTVKNWTLDELKDGEEFLFTDTENPDLGYEVRVWVQNGSMYARIANAKGSAQTGKYRPVKPCEEGGGGGGDGGGGGGGGGGGWAQTQTVLKTIWGTYWTVDADKRVVPGDRGSPVEFVPHAGKMAIKLAGQFVAADGGGGGVLHANRDAIGEPPESSWELFVATETPEGTLTFQTQNGHYVSATDARELLAHVLSVGTWEVFTTEEVSMPTITVAPHNDGPLFRLPDATPWRYRGVTAFRLAKRFADGADVRTFLQPFADLQFNVLRLFDYATWDPPQGWEPVDAAVMRDFYALCGQWGFYVENCVLTSDEAWRLDVARSRIDQWRDVVNLFIECGNEPITNKQIDYPAMRGALEGCGHLYSSGLYEDTRQDWYGTYGTAHTPRDAEWPRKAHDLMEYYNGGGPNAQDEPACKVPWVADEPIRPDQAGYVDTDYEAYGGVAAILGAGATFHFESGKYGNPPTADELRCAKSLARGLLAFPADAVLLPYERIDEPGVTLRTYKKGPYIVRVRPTSGDILIGGTPPW